MRTASAPWRACSDVPVMTAAMIAPSTRIPIASVTASGSGTPACSASDRMMAKDLLFMGLGQRADARIFLVVFGHRVDEGAAVEAFLLEPVLQHVEDADQLVPGRPAKLVQRRLEPSPPCFAFPFQHGEDKALLGAELIVQRHLGDARLRQDLVDARGVDPMKAEQACGGIEKPVPGFGRVLLLFH